MKVVFLCNRLSRTKLRGSWQALLEASGQGAGAGAGAGGGASGEEVNQAGAEPSTCGKTVKGEVEVRPGGVTLVRDRRLERYYCQVVTVTSLAGSHCWTLSSET